MPGPPSRSRAPTGSGFLFVVALVAGLVLGAILRQPTLGFLGGMAAGLLIAGALWWRDRRRGVD